MRDFGSIVGVSLHGVSHDAEGRPNGSGVAPQLIGDDPLRFGTLAAQQPSKESLCGALIPMRLDQDVDHVTILIHGTPQILLLAVDSNEDLVKVPMVTEPSLTSLQFPSIVRTELLTPPSDRLIRHADSSLGEKILDIPKAQAEAMVNPDRIADDFRWETIAEVRRPIALHAVSVSVSRSS